MFKRIVLAAAIVVPAFVLASGASAQSASAPAAKSATPAPAPATSPAPAPATKAGKPGAFDRLDANHDEKLTREEAKGSKRITSRFDALDANKDGVLSRDEIRAMAPKRKGTEAKPAA